MYAFSSAAVRAVYMPSMSMAGVSVGMGGFNRFLSRFAQDLCSHVLGVNLRLSLYFLGKSENGLEIAFA